MAGGKLNAPSPSIGGAMKHKDSLIPCIWKAFCLHFTIKALNSRLVAHQRPRIPLLGLPDDIPQLISYDHTTNFIFNMQHFQDNKKQQQHISKREIRNSTTWNYVIKSNSPQVSITMGTAGLSLSSISELILFQESFEFQ